MKTDTEHSDSTNQSRYSDNNYMSHMTILCFSDLQAQYQWENAESYKLCSFECFGTCNPDLRVQGNSSDKKNIVFIIEHTL